MPATLAFPDQPLVPLHDHTRPANSAFSIFPESGWFYCGDYDFLLLQIGLTNNGASPTFSGADIQLIWMNESVPNSVNSFQEWYTIGNTTPTVAINTFNIPVRAKFVRINVIAWNLNVTGGTSYIIPSPEMNLRWALAGCRRGIMLPRTENAHLPVVDQAFAINLAATTRLMTFMPRYGPIKAAIRWGPGSNGVNINLAYVAPGGQAKSFRNWDLPNPTGDVTLDFTFAGPGLLILVEVLCFTFTAPQTVFIRMWPDPQTGG